MLAELIEADRDAGRLLACTLYARAGPDQTRSTSTPRSESSTTRWLTLGSANLNEHSLFNDTEMNIVAHDKDLAARTRRQLWAEHLELPIDQVPLDPIEAIDKLWKPISKEQLERRPAGKPLTHRLVRLPHVRAEPGRVLGPLNGLIVDG